MVEVTGKIEATHVVLYLQKLTPAIISALRSEMGNQSGKLLKYITSRHMTGGTTADKLKVRSGNLRRTTVLFLPRAENDRIVGGIQFGAKYARTHVGPMGQVTTIRPIKSRFLAIPIGDALTASGVPRFTSPRNVPNLKFVPRSGGSPMLVQVIGGRTLKSGAVSLRGLRWKPMYILKRSINVKARIHPEEIMAAKGQDILNGFISATKKAVASTGTDSPRWKALDG